MRLIVDVLPLSEVRNNGPAAYIAPRASAPQPKRFSIQVKPEDTFEQVWAIVEQRYKENYLTPQQAQFFTIKKIQDAYDCDLDVRDTVGATFEGETDREKLKIKVFQSFIDREFSVPVTSNLRPVNVHKRLRELRQSGSNKRRRVDGPRYDGRLDELDVDSPLPSREHSTDGVGAEGSRRDGSQDSVIYVADSQTEPLSRDDINRQPTPKLESPELGEQPLRRVPEADTRVHATQALGTRDFSSATAPRTFLKPSIPASRLQSAKRSPVSPPSRSRALVPSADVRDEEDHQSSEDGEEAEDHGNDKQPDHTSEDQLMLDAVEGSDEHQALPNGYSSHVTTPEHDDGSTHTIKTSARLARPDIFDDIQSPNRNASTTRQPSRMKTYTNSLKGAHRMFRREADAQEISESPERRREEPTEHDDSQHTISIQENEGGALDSRDPSPMHSRKKLEWLRQSRSDEKSTGLQTATTVSSEGVENQQGGTGSESSNNARKASALKRPSKTSYKLSKTSRPVSSNSVRSGSSPNDVRSTGGDKWDARHAQKIEEEKILQACEQRQIKKKVHKKAVDAVKEHFRHAEANEARQRSEEKALREREAQERSLSREVSHRQSPLGTNGRSPSVSVTPSVSIRPIKSANAVTNTPKQLASAGKTDDRTPSTISSSYRRADALVDLGEHVDPISRIGMLGQRLTESQRQGSEGSDATASSGYGPDSPVAESLAGVPLPEDDPEASVLRRQASSTTAPKSSGELKFIIYNSSPATASKPAQTPGNLSTSLPSKFTRFEPIQTAVPLLSNVSRLSKTPSKVSRPSKTPSKKSRTSKTPSKVHQPSQSPVTDAPPPPIEQTPSTHFALSTTEIPLPDNVKHLVNGPANSSRSSSAKVLDHVAIPPARPQRQKGKNSNSPVVNAPQATPVQRKINTHTITPVITPAMRQTLLGYSRDKGKEKVIERSPSPKQVVNEGIVSSEDDALDEVLTQVQEDIPHAGPSMSVKQRKKALLQRPSQPSPRSKYFTPEVVEEEPNSKLPTALVADEHRSFGYIGGGDAKDGIDETRDPKELLPREKRDRQDHRSPSVSDGDDDGSEDMQEEISVQDWEPQKKINDQERQSVSESNDEGDEAAVVQKEQDFQHVQPRADIREQDREPSTEADREMSDAEGPQDDSVLPDDEDAKAPEQEQEEFQSALMSPQAFQEASSPVISRSLQDRQIENDMREAQSRSQSFPRESSEEVKKPSRSEVSSPNGSIRDDLDDIDDPRLSQDPNRATKTISNAAIQSTHDSGSESEFASDEDERESDGRSGSPETGEHAGHEAAVYLSRTPTPENADEEEDVPVARDPSADKEQSEEESDESTPEEEDKDEDEESSDENLEDDTASTKGTDVEMQDADSDAESVVPPSSPPRVKLEASQSSQRSFTSINKPAQSSQSLPRASAAQKSLSSAHVKSSSPAEPRSKSLRTPSTGPRSSQITANVGTSQSARRPLRSQFPTLSQISAGIRGPAPARTQAKNPATMSLSKLKKNKQLNLSDDSESEDSDEESSKSDSSESDGDGPGSKSSGLFGAVSGWFRKE